MILINLNWDLIVSHTRWIPCAAHVTWIIRGYNGFKLFAILNMYGAASVMNKTTLSILFGISIGQSLETVLVNSLVIGLFQHWLQSFGTMKQKRLVWFHFYTHFSTNHVSNKIEKKIQKIKEIFYKIFTRSFFEFTNLLLASVISSMNRAKFAHLLFLRE